MHKDVLFVQIMHKDEMSAAYIHKNLVILFFVIVAKICPYLKKSIHMHKDVLYAQSMHKDEMLAQNSVSKDILSLWQQPYIRQNSH